MTVRGGRKGAAADPDSCAVVAGALWCTSEQLTIAARVASGRTGPAPGSALITLATDTHALAQALSDYVVAVRELASRQRRVLAESTDPPPQISASEHRAVTQTGKALAKLRRTAQAITARADG